MSFSSYMKKRSGSNKSEDNSSYSSGSSERSSFGSYMSGRQSSAPKQNPNFRDPGKMWSDLQNRYSTPEAPAATAPKYTPQDYSAAINTFNAQKAQRQGNGGSLQPEVGTKIDLSKVKTREGMSEDTGLSTSTGKAHILNAGPANNTELGAWAAKHPLAGTALYPVAGMVSGAEGLVNYGRALVGKDKLGEYDFHGPQMQNALREGVTTGVRDRLGFNDDHDYTFRDEAADFLTGVALDAAGSQANNMLFGPAGLALMAGGATNQALYDASKDSGTTRGQALALSLANGIAEAAFERFSIENMESMKQVPVKALRDVVKNVAKSFVTEGSEESFTEIANIMSDIFIRGENSELGRAYQNRLASGMNSSDALSATIMDGVKQVGLAGLGGAISGAGTGTLYSGINIAQNYNQINDYSASDYAEISDTIDTSTEIGKAAADKAAELAYRSEQGEQISKMDNAMLSSLINQTVSEASANEAVQQNEIEEVAEKSGPEGAVNESEAETASEEQTKAPKIAQLSYESGYGREGTNAINKVISDTFNSDGDERAVYAAQALYNQTRYGIEMNEAAKAAQTLLNADQIGSVITAASNDLDRSGELKDINKIRDIAAKYRDKSITPGKATYDFNIEQLRTSKNKQDNVKYAQVKTINHLLNDVLGMNVRWIRSTTNENNEYTTENGSFDRLTGTITLDVNGGLMYGGQSADSKKLGLSGVTNVVAHETTHWLERDAPDSYRTIQSKVLSALSEARGITVQDLIAEQYELHPKSVRDDEDAVHEITARSMEDILNGNEETQKIFDEMSEGEKKTIFDHIRNIFASIKNFINEMLGTVSNANEAKVLRDFLSDVEKAELRTLYNEGIKTAAAVNEGRKAGELSGDNTGNVSEDLKEDFGLTEGNGNVSVSFSERSWTNTDKAELLEGLVAAGFEREQASKWIKDVSSIGAMIAKDRGRLDYEAADNQTMLKFNQEYFRTLDASTLCAKRLLYQGTYNAIQKQMPNTPLLSTDVIRIRQMLNDNNEESPCGICYVESRRRHLGRYAQRWLNTYEGEYKPTIYDVTATDGLEALRLDHPEAYQSFMEAMKKKGTANPKVVELRTDYKGEIRSLTKRTIDKITRIGGLRVQSFSDFELIHTIDMMQAVLDMSRMGLTAQAYTKVPAFAAIFGDTGIKINLSLIGDVDENGTLVFDDKEGINSKEAFKLRNKYSQNVGTILVGRNDAHILAAMADPRIDFIIPFHRSGWGKAQFAELGLTNYTDYQRTQNETNLDGSKIKSGNLYPIDYWDYSKTGKENAERYLEICAEQKRKPKFAQFLTNNHDGSWSLKEDGSTDGYWKLLIDFKMYDNDGNGAPQQKVTGNFNMREARKALNTFDGKTNELPLSRDVVDRFVKEYKEKHKRVQYSERDTSQSYAPVFYSKLQNEVEAFKGDKIGAASIESYLKGKGVKDEEIKWSGLRTFVEGKKSVSKSELMGYLKANEIQMDEVTKADAEEGEAFTDPETGKKVDRAYIEAGAKDYVDLMGLDHYEINYNERGASVSFFDEDDFEWETMLFKNATETNWGKYKVSGGKNYIEYLFKMPGADYSNNAMSAHWNDSGVLAHARVQDMSDGYGRKILFVEEIQSDWHNAGKKSGYQGESDDLRDLKKKYTKERDAFANKKVLDSGEFSEEDKARYVKGTRESLAEIPWPVYGKMLELSEEGNKEFYKKFPDKQKLIFDNLSNYESPAPDAPYRTSYTDFVMKNLLRKAAEGGYDAVAWTSADMQSKRWSDEYAEGYRIEYDQEIPSFLKKYGKQWGAKLERIDLAGVDGKQTGDNVQAIPVTDSMRSDVLYKGQTRYSERLEERYGSYASSDRIKFDKYNQKSIDNWIGSRKIEVCESWSQIEDFIEKAEKKENAGKKLYLGTISEELADRIFSDTGINIKGFNFTIGSDEVRKIENRHGSEKVEKRKKQTAIGSEDITVVPIVISEYDSATKSVYESKGALQKDAILFKKDIDGVLTAVTIVNSGKKDLRLQTLYKERQKNETSQRADGTTPPTLYARSGAGTVSNDIISNNEIDTRSNVRRSNRDNTITGYEARTISSAEQLERQNEKLRDMAQSFSDALAERGALKGKLSDAQIHRIAQSLVKEYCSTVDIKQIESGLKSMYTYMDENARASAKQLTNLAARLGADIISKSMTEDNSLKEQYPNLAKEIAGYQIRVPDTVEKELAYKYDSYNNFRRQHFGLISTSRTEGTEVDTIYQQLSENYPELFPVEVDNDADRMMRIAEVAKELKGKRVKQEYGADFNEVAYTIGQEMLAKYFQEKGDSRHKRSVDAIKAEMRSRQIEQLAALRKAQAAEIERLKKRYENGKRVKELKDQINRLKSDPRYTWARLNEYYAHREEVAKMRRADYEARMHLLKQMKALRRMHGPAEFEAAKAKLIENMDLMSTGLRKDKKLDLERIRREIEAQAAKDPAFAMSAEYQKTKEFLNKRLDGTHIRDLSMEDVLELTERVVNLKHEQETYNKLLKDDLGEYVATYGRKGVAQQKNVTGIMSDNKIRNALTKFSLYSLNPTRAAHMLDGYQKDGVFTYMFDALNEGAIKADNFRMEANKMFEEVLKNKELVNTFSDQNIPLEPLIGEKGEGLYISKGMRISIALHHMSMANRAHIEKSGFNIPDAKLYKAGKYTDAYNKGTLVVMSAPEVLSIIGQMTDAEREYVEVAYDFFNTMSKRALNEASLKLKGYEIATVDKYFPIVTDKNFTPVEIDGIKLDASIEGMGMLKERKGGTNPILLEDAAQVVERQINSVARYSGLAIPVRDANKIWNYTSTGYADSLKSSVAKAWGQAGKTYIENVLTDIQTARRTDGSSQIFNLVKGKYAAAVLGTNLGVTIKQFASYPFAATILDNESLIAGLASKTDREYIDSITPLSWTRRQGMSGTEMGEVYKQKNIVQKNAALQKIKGAFNWIQMMDVFTTDRLFGACEHYVKKNNPDLEVRGDEYNKKVAELYNEVLQRTQPSYGVMQHNEWLRSTSDAMKAFTAFKTQTFNMGGELIDAVAEAKAMQDLRKNELATETDVRRARVKMARTVAATVASQALLTALTVVANGVLHKMKPYRNDDGEVTKESVIKKYLSDLYQSFAGMFLGGSELQSFVLAVTGQQKWYDITLPSFDSVNDFVQAVTKWQEAMVKLKEHETDANKKAVTQSANLVIKSMQVFGIPTNNAYNIVNAVNLWNQDRENGEFLTFEAGEGILGITDTSNSDSIYYDRAFNALYRDKNWNKFYETYNRMRTKNGKDKANSAIRDRIKKTSEVVAAGNARFRGDVEGEKAARASLGAWAAPNGVLGPLVEKAIQSVASKLEEEEKERNGEGNKPDTSVWNGTDQLGDFSSKGATKWADKGGSMEDFAYFKSEYEKIKNKYKETTDRQRAARKLFREGGLSSADQKWMWVNVCRWSEKTF